MDLLRVYIVASRSVYSVYGESDQNAFYILSSVGCAQNNKSHTSIVLKVHRVSDLRTFDGQQLSYFYLFFFHFETPTRNWSYEPKYTFWTRKCFAPDAQDLRDYSIYLEIIIFIVE